MSDLAKRLAGLGGIHQKIADDVFPGGGRLECAICGKKHTITSGDAAEYLAKGWPRCCGQTMTFSARPPKGVK